MSASAGPEKQDFHTFLAQLPWIFVFSLNCGGPAFCSTFSTFFFLPFFRASFLIMNLLEDTAILTYSFFHLLVLKRRSVCKFTVLMSFFLCELHVFKEWDAKKPCWETLPAFRTLLAARWRKFPLCSRTAQIMGQNAYFHHRLLAM